ncbi:uncharacterized protein LOC133479786 isoform X1 [Phyllopteryx taeniolatus]|uniref:uncharacterized protein LOC133479786 isoform X1 n=1 Tax=Phyllopteryx taeniolatus TaxID=161469 RepID=UPI002AD2E102|nr:uncharacterized protein LOC133479786 isoform X1 [Phyllopteryx taeniolatus]
MSVRFHPSAVCTSICSEELFSVRTETMGTTEATFTDHNDFEYDEETLRTTGLVLAIVMFVAGILIALNHLILQYQRQTCLLQLYSKRSHLFKQSEAGVTRREAYRMHKCFMTLSPQLDDQ